jgi:putative ABC transport system permease protein
VPNFASLPFTSAVFLIVLSTLLTLIAGLFPSRIAAKRDPVVALRTE